MKAVITKILRKPVKVKPNNLFDTSKYYLVTFEYECNGKKGITSWKFDGEKDAKALSVGHEFEIYSDPYK